MKYLLLGLLILVGCGDDGRNDKKINDKLELKNKAECIKKTNNIHYNTTKGHLK